MMNNIIKAISELFTSVAAIFLTSAIIFTLPIMWCWNYVIPYLFGLKTIGLLQAFCLSILSTILIKTTVRTK